MRYLLVLLSPLLLAGCFTNTDYLSERAKACHRQGYGGMVVQVQTNRNDDGKRMAGYVLTTSCFGPQTGGDAAPQVAAPSPRVYKT